MPDSITAAGVLLALGPLVGAIPVANPSLLRVWSASRDEHLAIIGAHRVAWAALNLGFGLATIATAAGLAVLALAADPDTARAAALAVVASPMRSGARCGARSSRSGRARRRPRGSRPRRAADRTRRDPARRSPGGLFAAFVVATCAALTVLGAHAAGDRRGRGARGHRDARGRDRDGRLAGRQPAMSSRPCCTCPRCWSASRCSPAGPEEESPMDHSPTIVRRRIGRASGRSFRPPCRDAPAGQRPCGGVSLVFLIAMFVAFGAGAQLDRDDAGLRQRHARLGVLPSGAAGGRGDPRARPMRRADAQPRAACARAGVVRRDRPCSAPAGHQCPDLRAADRPGLDRLPRARRLARRVGPPRQPSRHDPGRRPMGPVRGDLRRLPVLGRSGRRGSSTVRPLVAQRG